ncbi:MAG: hydroxymethylbilane synthase [Proteobacteria bacterium]|nr:hydroxymethylbilane synthase [Pseudomonadota bacterium]MBU1641382.1 hydroxymethylbilane synthase [Pseudomonadota bacterium]
MTTITIGSRKSQLAMWQTYYVEEKLKAAGIETKIITMETKGDKILNTSIAKIGSKGVFTEELEEKLADGTLDIAVHSAKDMPSLLPEGFELIAFTDREKANDVVLSHKPALSLVDTGKKIVLGTSSVRRRALLALHYPHVETVDIRGNLQTRIKKMKEGLCDGIMLAYAGVHRMELGKMIVHTFPEEQFVPPVGQGCVAIEAYAGLSQEKRDLVRACLNNTESEARLLAERGFLRKLEGGCSIPAFALATLNGNELTLTAGLVSLDGKKNIRATLCGPKAEAARIGKELGTKILADGGKEVLAEIRRQQAADLA